jgi:hypothetical protein
MKTREEEALVMMGRVLEAHQNRWTSRRNAKKAHLDAENLPQRDRVDWPEEGGAGWKSAELSQLEGVAHYTRYQKVQAESKFKAMYLGFIEIYPEKTIEITKALKAQSDIHAEKSKHVSLVPEVPAMKM